MSDITIRLGAEGLSFGGFVGDVLLADGDLTIGDDLKTSILVSLFSDLGWWADIYEPGPIGSALMTLRRAKHSNETLLLARDYCQQALSWLVEDQVASAVDVQTSWSGTILLVAIVLTQATGITRYSFEWAGI